MRHTQPLHYIDVRLLNNLNNAVHRHFQSSPFATPLGLGTQPAPLEVSERLRLLREAEVISYGPWEPLRVSGKGVGECCPRLHLLEIGETQLDHGALRKHLGEERIGLRLHRKENPAQALDYLLDRTTRDDVDAVAIARRLPGCEAGEMLKLLRARRNLRSIPLFVCDSTYCSRTSRCLYAAGANGYLCGAAATRQLGAALRQFQVLRRA